MIRRLLWFALGAGFAVWASGKVRGYLRAASPEAVGQRVSASVGGLGDSARDFLARVRAASAEREAELRSALREPGSGHALNQGRPGSDVLGLPE